MRAEQGGYCVARIAGLLHKASKSGFQTITQQTDIRRFDAFIQTAIDKIQLHDSHERFREIGCEVLNEVARFEDAHSVMLGETLVQTKRFVIATGSRACIPPIDGLESIDYLTNDDMYSLDVLPQRLLVLDGGPVGVEMAQAYARLGSRVTLVELEDRILPRSDPELSLVLAQQLKSDGVEIIHGEVLRLRSEAGSILAEFQNGTEIVADKLLVAIGRWAVVDNLGLDQAGVVIANAVFRLPKRIDYRVIPSVVYTKSGVCAGRYRYEWHRK